MANKTSRLTFDQQGGMKIDHTGFTGNACEVATEKLLAGLGAAKRKVENKPELFQQNTGSHAHQAASKW